jgi:hypothetical protein
MSFCEKCGAAVKPDLNFCGNCGAPQNANHRAQFSYSSVPPPPNYHNSIGGLAESSTFQPPYPQRAVEQIASFIIVNKSKRFGGEEYFTGILTTTQLIFAPMTKEMLKEVTNISRQQAKNPNNPPTSVYPYQQLYLNVPPSTILNQTPGCIPVQNSSIREINVKLVNSIGDGYSDFQEYEMQIVFDMQTLTFRMTKRDEYVIRLKQVYQEKVRLH